MTRHPLRARHLQLDSLLQCNEIKLCPQELDKPRGFFWEFAYDSSNLAKVLIL